MLVIGIGNAGVNLADRMTMESLPVSKIIAVNTDSHSLMSSITVEKVVLGTIAARGLGAGGDPEVGAKAAEENMTEIRAHVEGHPIVTVCAGLGGGTGSGAAPLIARTAREAGAFVIALVTLPFSFEGRRRAKQTEDALALLEKSADLLLCFENDRMSEITQPGAGVEDTFEKSDILLEQCLKSLVHMIELPGLMRVSLSDLSRLLDGRNPRCLFGAGESEAENRAFDAVGKALKCPLLGRKLLSESRTVIVHIAGSSDVSLAEIGVIMREVEKYTDSDAHLMLGIGLRNEMSPKLTVSVLGCLSQPVQRDEEEEATAPVAASANTSRQERPAQPETEEEEAPAAQETGGPKKTIPATDPRPRRAIVEDGKKGTKPKQEFLPFDSVNRGRFEKSEPTIVEGEDLDVPTFLRMKIKVK